MDSLDYKILWLLDLDGRMPVAEIARRVKRSQQVTSSRFHRLRRLGVIRKSVTLVNMHMIGFLSFRVYLRMRQISRDMEDELCKVLQKRQDVLWFVELRGGWDYEIVFLVRDYVQFNRIWKSLLEQFGVFYERSEISMSTVTHHFRRDYLVKGSRGEFTSVRFGDVQGVVLIDDADRKLLKILSQNARTPLKQIARAIKVGYPNVKERLQRLEEQRIIQAYRMAPNLKLLGRRYFKALIKVNYQGREKERALFGFCAQFPFVTYLSDILGSWQFEIECEVADQGELHELLRRVRREFPDQIKDYEIVEVTREFVLDYIPSFTEA